MEVLADKLKNIEELCKANLKICERNGEVLKDIHRRAVEELEKIEKEKDHIRKLSYSGRK